MNYAGKFDAAISLDGQGSRSPADVHVDSFTAKAHGHVPDGAFVVPDPNLIFNGEFKRTGLDLVLSHDGHEFVVHDYFRGDKRAAIASPDGAHLTGDTVNALTGHVQYAQAAAGAAAAQVIGHVTKLSGSATAIRNGVSVILNNGDNVEKGDVVSTGADSTLGITFIDGTVFGLSSNARMVLNEMVYDPNGSSNSSLLSLVAGTITFVAGETAKHGDMKIDTPVATMGIRGTAVLTQINFVVPAGGGDPQPQASFQVLVEPNGTTGSYILFDKVTLLPIATVNQAGQMIQISGGNVSITNALMSPDVQKLITDVFTLKFTDNNTNTKLTTNFTDTVTPTSDGVLIKTQNGATATVIITNVDTQQSTGSNTATPTANRAPGPPDSRSLDSSGNVKTAFGLTERADKTGDAAVSDTVSGRITFLDQNLGDRPTVKISLADAPNYIYKNAGQQDVTASLTALQKQDIAATQVQINVVPEGGNNNAGSAVWTYTVPDNVFDFLAAGETLTLTYMVSVNNNFSVNPETALIPITITITGTNDKPVITTGVPTITFEGGTSVPGGPLTSHVPTSGTLTFKDVDLTDTHTVGVSHFSAVLPGGTVPDSVSTFLANALSVSIATGKDSTGSGTGTINWSLADIPVYLADFIPKDAVLTLTYTVTVTDSQGATSNQTVTVTITGTDAPAVVWIATDKPGVPSGGFWKDGANWETGVVPTAADDVIVITDQLHGLTPSYPVTIDVAAYGKSLTMDDYDTTAHHTAPEVINKSTLTISGALTLNADAKFTNALGASAYIGGLIDVETITRKSGTLVTNTSTITNAGTLTLAAGGTIATKTTIVNSGTIDLTGGTLALKTGIANTGGTVQVESGATLAADTVTLDGGTITILGTLQLDGADLVENGTLTNSGAVNVTGNTEFAQETVSNTASGTIKVLANGWLTVDQGFGITNTGHVTIAGNGKLTVNGATLGGAGTVTNDGEIDLTGSAVLSGGTLNNNATFKASGTGNALNGETVTNAGTIEVMALGALAIGQNSKVGNAAGSIVVDDSATLTLNGAEITGGAINNYSVLGGTIDVVANSKIDGNATLTKGAVTVESGVTLTLDDATVAAATVTNHGTVNVDLNKTLTLSDSKLKGGALTVAGTLDSSGSSSITDTSITNSGLIEAVGGVLAIAATTSATLANTGTLQAKGAELDLTNEAINNSGTLAAINDGKLKLTSTTVTNTGNGAVTVGTGSSRLELNDATVDGGTLTIAGTLQSTGTSFIKNSDITNTGTITTVTGGTLTIDPAVLHTLTNHGLIQADGAELDVSGENITNTADIKAINQGILKLTNLTVTDSSTGAITVATGSKLYLTDVSINGGSLSNAGNLFGVSGASKVTASVTNTGTIDVQGGTLNLAGGLTGVGKLIVDNGATLELGGADAQSVTFSGGTATLLLDKVSGQSFTGTISAGASADGTFTVTGAADIDSLAGDALDFTVLSGVHAGATLTPTGTLKGAANGVVVTQNGVGDVSLTATGDITGGAGHGIALSDGLTGAGAITVNNLTGKATGTGADSTGVLAANLNAANSGDISVTQLGGAVGGAYGIEAITYGGGDLTIVAGGAITGSAVYGIRALSYGKGSETVTTKAGSVVTSDSSGIVAVNRATSIAAGQSTITVNAYGTINSGSSPNQSGTAPAGIQTGYTGAETGTNATANVNGTVLVNNYADIHAAGGYGINAYNFGNGDVTVKDGAGTTVVGAVDGIRAQVLSGVTGNVSVSLGTNASVTGNSGYGVLADSTDQGDVTVSLAAGASAKGNDDAIRANARTGGDGNIDISLGDHVSVTSATGYGLIAYSERQGDISVTMATGDLIDTHGTGSSGIVAVNYATAIAGTFHSQISVEAHGTIKSGTANNHDGTTPGGIIAGYKPGGSGTASTAVNGDVVVTSDATITADAGYGIQAFTWGVGKITVTTGAGSLITSAGTAIAAFNHGGGDVSVTNEGKATGAVALGVVAAGTGDVTILNDGQLTATGTAGIVVTQNDTGDTGNPVATGSTHIINNGSVVGASGHYAIFVQENTTGTATIDNSGTIGPADAGTVTSTTYAIAESGGAITINNTGTINGSINVASATFHNGAHGIWTVAGTSVFGSASSILNDGIIDLHGASISGGGLSITNSQEIDSWGTASIKGTLANTGAVEVHDGALTLFGQLSGSGSVTVDAGATLVVKDMVSQTITLAGDGAGLRIDTSSFSGSIAGLSANDKIDLSSIVYDDGTSATYDAATGKLVVSDAHHHTITLQLIGSDYCHAHFAGSSDGHGGTLITFNAADDKPSFTVAEASPSVSFSELADTTGSSALDPASGGTGVIHFHDIDLTDRPTATITDQAVSGLAADLSPLTFTQDQSLALEHALTLQQAGQNNGAVTWTYSIADGALDFLGEGQTAKVVSTITLDDHEGGTDTAQVTVTITGKNDAPTLANATLASVSEDTAAPAGSTVDNLFSAGFHDVDANSHLKAVAVTADHATAAQGVWQYEVAGSDQWIAISGVSDGHALVLAADTLLRFVPAANYSGVPGGLDLHALDDSYSGGSTDTSPVSIDIAAVGSSVSSAAATLGTEVTPVADPPAFKALVVNYLADGLTSTTIDGSNWTVVLPEVTSTSNSPSVTATTHGVELHDRGTLQTTTGFTPTAATPLHISLTFSHDGSTGSFVEVADGTNGATGSLYGQPANGISYMFGFGNGLLINENATGAREDLWAPLAADTLYDAAITDDGTHQTVVIVNHATGGVVGTYSTDIANDLAGNLVSISNREANDGDHTATVSNVVISNAFEGAHGTPISLSSLTGLTDTDGSEHLSLDLSGFPDGTTFSVGQAGTGAAAGHWLISASDLEAPGAPALTMTTPADYSGQFSLHVSGAVLDEATGLSGTPLSDSKTFTSDIAVAVDGGPVIDTAGFSVEHSNENSTDIIHDLVIADSDVGAATHNFAVTVSTAHPDLSTAEFDPASGSLDAINTGLESGISYHPTGATSDPEASPPDQDQITLTVRDTTTGLYDTVNFIFNEAGEGPVTLTGTAGKDVIFATETGDTLTGGGGKDQFVFAPGSVTSATHTITDFIEGLDRIDLRQFADVTSMSSLHISGQSGDTLVTWDQQIGSTAPATEHESLLLKSVTASLKTSDFIFHA